MWTSRSRVGIGSATFAAAISACVWVMADEPASGDTPADSTKQSQTTCPSAQLATDRGCVTPPRTLKLVPPRYPAAARRAEARSEVTLKVVIEADGKVGKVEVLKCTRSGLGFEEAAIESIKQSKYAPATLGDQPIAVVMTTVVRFTM